MTASNCNPFDQTRSLKRHPESQHPIRLIVGLGNPGRRYEATRHNAGFMVIDALREAFSIPLTKSRFDTLLGRGRIRGRDVILAKPQAYMNVSGPPILDLMNHFGLLGRQMLVIYDDIDLAFGRLKIQEKGGSGGHKGIGSIIDALGDEEFTRLRLGVGRPANGADVVEHVLAEFTAQEKQVLGQVITFAGEAATTILCKGAREGMNRFNKSIV